MQGSAKRMSRMRSTAVVFGAVAILVVALFGVLGRPDSEPKELRAEATATGLILDGERWWPAGANAYQLATDWSVNVGCGAQVDLDRYFSAVPRRALTRFNLFAALAVNKETGEPDFSAVDAVFAAAEKHRRPVLPVLTSGEGACENGKFKDRQWYRTGWKADVDGPHGTFEEWVDTAVSRWRNEPSLIGWEPVGEPEPADCADAECDWQERTCADDASRVLRQFFDEIGERIRAEDPGRLIFTGTAGGDQCGSVGGGYELLARSPGVDVLDFHDYPLEAGLVPADSTLAARLAIARAAGKPLVVSEVGLRAGSCLSTAERAEQLRARIEEHRRLGAAGALVWAFVPDPRNDMCTYDVGPDDPFWESVDELTR